MSEKVSNLDELVKRCQRGRRPPRGDEVISWSEPDVLDGKEVQAFCVILRTRGCSWDKCTVCGYNEVSDPKMNYNGIMKQFARAMDKFQKQKIVKLFNSGSFFNDEEMPPEARISILKSLNGKTAKLIVETRAEHVNREKLQVAKDLFQNLEIAIGMESADNGVLKCCINKGMTFAEYVKAAETVKSCSLMLKSYLLLKPPFLTEKEAIDDAVRSIEAAGKYSDEISLNPVNVQRHTVVEYLWRRNGYRAPWLWSIVKVLEEGRKTLSASVRLMSSPTGGSTSRGAHNCGKCDGAVLSEIQKFSPTQDASVFKTACSCKEEWLDLLDLETLAHTSADIGRILKGPDW